MTNAVIVHGMPSKDEYYSVEYPSMSNSHWVPWLQKQLLVNDIITATPEMPYAFKPDYPTWKKEFERFDIGPDTLLVGHSCGGGFLVRWLSENERATVKKVVLVAPWLDPFREDTTDFFEFAIDPKLAGRAGELWVYDSDTDSDGVHTSVQKLLAEVDGVKYREFHNYGHFFFKDLGTDAFPELLEVLVDV